MPKTSKKEKAPENKLEDKLFESVLAKHSKKLGFDILIKPKDLLKPLAFSTGSLTLDYLIDPDSGGIADGRFYEFWGEPSVGKSTMAIQIAANVVHNNEKVVYYDLENGLSTSILEQMGIAEDDERFHLLPCSVNASTAFNFLKDILPTKTIKLVIIDSLAKVRPEFNADDITKSMVAEQANFITKVLPNLAMLAASSGVSFLIINQARANQGSRYIKSKPYEVYSHNHDLALRMQFKGTATKSDTSGNKITNAHGDMTGFWSTAEVQKSKMRSPLGSLRVPLIFAHGTDPFLELSELAVRFGVLEASGSWYNLPNGEKIQGQQRLTVELAQNKELFDYVRAETIKKLGIRYNEKRSSFNVYTGLIKNPVFSKEELASVHPVQYELKESKELEETPATT